MWSRGERVARGGVDDEEDVEVVASEARTGKRGRERGGRGKGDVRGATRWAYRIGSAERERRRRGVKERCEKSKWWRGHAIS